MINKSKPKTKTIVEKVREEILASYGIYNFKPFTDEERAIADSYDVKAALAEAIFQRKQKEVEDFKEKLERELPINNPEKKEKKLKV